MATGTQQLLQHVLDSWSITAVDRAAVTHGLAYIQSDTRRQIAWRPRWPWIATSGAIRPAGRRDTFPRQVPRSWPRPDITACHWTPSVYEWISCPHARHYCVSKGAIASEIKHAIKLKTSPATLAQLLQPSSAFCFSLQPMTVYRPGLDGTPSLAAS